MEAEEKRQSLRALDGTNFFLADVETGVGPFVATYLSASQHWNPAQIGLVTGAQNLAAVLAQAPAGWWIDNSSHKRWLVAGGGLVLSAGSLAVLHAPTLWLQVLNQAAIGVALAIILPCVSAISLGIVGKAKLSPRIGRNAAFIHAGNALTAILAGYLSFRHGQNWIFYVSAVFGIFAVASSLLIRSEDIDDEAARAKEDARAEAPESVGAALQRPELLRFLTLLVVFHIANSSMLPLAGQELAHRAGRSAGALMAACIVVSQIIMGPSAWLCGKLTDRTGRKPLFVGGFLVLALRGLLFTVFTAPWGIIAIEALDGVGTAIAGVLTVVVISDLAAGTGRFNLMQGFAQAALGVGAFVGKLGSGWIARAISYHVAFMCLMTVAISGALFFALLIKETLPARQS